MYKYYLSITKNIVRLPLVKGVQGRKEALNPGHMPAGGCLGQLSPMEGHTPAVPFTVDNRWSLQAFQFLIHFGSAGVGKQGLQLCRQALYCLSHALSSFVFHHYSKIMAILGHDPISEAEMIGAQV
jgi:hypothetical protein